MFIKTAQENNHTVYNFFGIKFKIKNPRIFKLKYLEVDIVDHCNLNCKGCTHFCPITEPNYMDVEEFKKDLKEFTSKIDELKQFRILGGEPLLHPDIVKFIQYSREILPSCDIRIVTNGLLLYKMNDEFFEACKKYNVLIDPSKYPVNQEAFGKGLDRIGDFDLQIGFLHLCKKFFVALISDGSSDKVETYRACKHKNCRSLRNGKLYRCPVGAFMPRYNKYFKADIPVEEGLNIYEASSEEIEKYLDTPFETCKFCLTPDKHKFVNWEVSKKDKDEWFADKI